MLVSYSEKNGLGGVIPSIFGTFAENKSINNVTDKLSEYNDEIKFTGEGIDGLNSEFKKSIDSLIKSDARFKDWIDEMKNANRTFANGAELVEEYGKSFKGTSGLLDKFKSGIKSVGASILSIGATMAIFYVLSETITSLVTVTSRFNNAVKETSEKLQTVKDELSDYKNRIADLHETLNDASSSMEEMSSARQSLLVIQTEMIDKYGGEKGAIEQITKAIEGQTDAAENLDDVLNKAFDTLERYEYLEKLNEFNNPDKSIFKKAADSISNWLNGYSNNVEKMVAQMEDPNRLLRDNGFTNVFYSIGNKNNGSDKAINDILQKFIDKGLINVSSGEYGYIFNFYW